MNNTFEVQILVNGNRCKQYKHQGKTYVQANPGSEYIIEIKNNHCRRILAVCSVDGLSVLSGEKASELDSGYVIDSYHAEKIKGFRYSDSCVGSFKFGYKLNGNTYAQSKQDNSEENCGIIGVRFYYEKEEATINMGTTPYKPINPWYPYPPHIISTATDITYRTLKNVTINSACCHEMTNGGNSGIGSFLCDKGFDVGTEWGRKQESKVRSISFEVGYLALSTDIYYASRESLIEMGIPLTNEMKINIPQSFPSIYAKPPKNWVG